MSFAEHASLPRSRSFRRAGSQRLWWVAVATAITVNLGMVLVLAQVSRLHPPAAEAPLAVRTLRQTPEPEAPPPPPEQAQQPTEVAPAQATPIALPSLDLPALPTTSELSLPAFPNPDLAISLPMTVPAFITLGTPTEALPASAGPIGMPAFDAPAQREGAFDLDRYYPRSARLRTITGNTRVRLSISAEGRVTAVEVLESSPPGVFERAAERLASSLRFRPATAAGSPVPSMQETTITWTMK
jgi:periplasmic protein TonB